MRQAKTWIGLLIAALLVLVLANVAVGGFKGPDNAANTANPANPATPAPAPQPAAGEGLAVRFVDVGQGDCALISCGGQNMLIDGGPADASGTVCQLLQSEGIDTLDYVVVTHPDADHSGGVAAEIGVVQVGAFFSSTTEGGRYTFDNLKRRLADRGLGINVPQVGDTLTLGQATVTFVGPVGAFEEENNNSLVLRIDYGATSFLFMADAEYAAEMALIDAGANVRATVLKVSHHGSAGATTRAFLQEVLPDYAVISVGQNDFGHPKPSVLERLDWIGARVLRTDESGTIRAQSDGTTVTFTTEKTAG
ncbi:MAG: ComEC/Rec2 family competence protein [Coriobacteriia bacterium]|nr:ComEC/Rec2 family competence protein [Coriobacteriia bacterium]